MWQAQVHPKRKHGGARRCSWTIDFAAHHTKARAEMLPLFNEAAQIKASVVDLKEQLNRMKKNKANNAELLVLTTQIQEQDKAARELEGRADDIDAAVFDLKAVNPTVMAEVDTHTPQQIFSHTDALARLNALMASTN